MQGMPLVHIHGVEDGRDEGVAWISQDQIGGPPFPAQTCLGLWIPGEVAEADIPRPESIQLRVNPGLGCRKAILEGFDLFQARIHERADLLESAQNVEEQLRSALRHGVSEDDREPADL